MPINIMVQTRLQNYNILFVHQDIDIIEKFKKILLEVDYKIYCATSYQSAINILNKKTIDILFLSINLPNLDKLLDQNSSIQIPMIFVDTAYNTHQKEKAYKIGGLSYIAPPFIQTEIQNITKNYLQLQYLTVQVEQCSTLNQDTQKKLKEAWDYYRDIVELSPDIIHSVNAKGDIIATNKRATEILGYSKEELLQMNVTELYAKDKHTILHDGFDRLKHDGARFNIESVLITKDSTRVPVEISSTSRYDDVGNFLATRSILRDITQRKKTEEELKKYREHLEDLVEERTKHLQESEQRFRQIVEKTDAGYVFIDTDGRIQQVNDAWLKMHGFTCSQNIIGKHFSITQMKSDLDRVTQTIQQLLKEENPSTGEFRRKQVDGTIGYHTFSINPVIKNGKVIGLEGFFIDTTSQKLAQLKDQENLKLKHQLELKEKQFQDFALRLTLKNRLLDTLQSEVQKVKQELSTTLTQKMELITNQIKAHKNQQQDWDIFETEFNRVHQNFTHRLAEKYPDLTPRQIKIAVLTRINMSSHEISEMLYLSPRSVESQRYRIRKKLGLSREQNLTSFLASL